MKNALTVSTNGVKGTSIHVREKPACPIILETVQKSRIKIPNSINRPMSLPEEMVEFRRQNRRDSALIFGHFTSEHLVYGLKP